MMRRFDELLSAPVPDRRQLLNTLSAEIQIHEQLEDELYYPAVRDLTPLVMLAHAEHRQLEDQLAVVLRTPLDSEPFPDEWRTLVWCTPWKGTPPKKRPTCSPKRGPTSTPANSRRSARRCKPAKPSS